MTIGNTEPRQPPVIKITPGKWLKKDLFSTWYNYILTFLSLCLVYWVASNLISWANTQAEWNVIQANFRLFFVGRYPLKALWRAWVTLGVVVSLGGVSWGILAHNAGKLFNLRILITLSLVAATCFAVGQLGGVRSSIILIEMLLLLIIAALIGQQVGKKFPDLSSWLPLLWLFAFSFNI